MFKPGDLVTGIILDHPACFLDPVTQDQTDCFISDEELYLVIGGHEVSHRPNSIKRVELVYVLAQGGVFYSSAEFLAGAK